jgi:Cof subfamily protein (haloacid dehalogenase superfamily)
MTTAETTKAVKTLVAERRPKYRMIAIDLDGTLLSPAGKVTERTRAAIHAALSAGLLVCFATGRNWTESKTVLDAVGHHDTAVFVGGAMVIDTKKQVTLHRTMMEPHLAAEVCRFFENEKHSVMALQDLGDAGMGYLISGSLNLHVETQQWLKVTRATVQEVHSLGEHPHDRTIRVGIIASSAKAADTHAKLIEAFGERLVCHGVGVIGRDIQLLEVFDPAVNKWEGIMVVARRHGITPEEIIAIGDDRNDLPMIRQAGLGVAMGNAHADVQAAAKRVIGSHADDGLAIFLEELVDRHKVQPLKQ